METLHTKYNSKIIENFPFCIQDTFITYINSGMHDVYAIMLWRSRGHAPLDK